MRLTTSRGARMALLWQVRLATCHYLLSNHQLGQNKWVRLHIVGLLPPPRHFACQAKKAESTAFVAAEITRAAYDIENYRQIMGVLARRLQDQGEDWRHVYKSLLLLEYMAKHGPQKARHLPPALADCCARSCTASASSFRSSFKPLCTTCFLHHLLKTCCLLCQ